jgi:hypothetical protein
MNSESTASLEEICLYHVVRLEIQSPRRVTCTGYVQKKQALYLLADDLSHAEWWNLS